MLNAIKNFFEQNISSDKSADVEHQLKLATAALLVEMMQQDHKVQDAERQAVKDALKKKFHLTEDETHELYTLAQQEADGATDYYQFTSLIARHYSRQQKIKLVEYLWTIACADTHLHPLEEHMIRRIADLIYVSHKDLIKTKLQVLNKKSGSDSN
jgi:uncharacterized tellurite resistance protein B-like protein